VEPGDVFFVDAGVIHAIGAGCLILEVQEPTDFTVQPEYWCGDYLLNHHEMYLTLDEDTALNCFHYDRYGYQVVTDGKKIPKCLYSDGKLLKESLIGPEDTPCFQVVRYTMNGTETVLDTPASVWICVEGEGRLCADGYDRSIKKGDYFFLPAAAAGNCKAVTENNMTLVCCVGGK
jgi:mannose-6-phosphate isomerase